MTYNVGVYGLRVEPYDKFIEANRLIEQKTRQLDGKKWFYAHSYYSEKEFWSIYDKGWYTKLRKAYHAEHLTDIYQRTKVTEKPQEINARKTVLNTILGRSGPRIVS